MSEYVGGLLRHTLGQRLSTCLSGVGSHSKVLDGRAVQVPVRVCVCVCGEGVAGDEWTRGEARGKEEVHTRHFDMGRTTTDSEQVNTRREWVWHATVAAE
jgi:hypothetical protein